jgi:iron complex outermembrane receptor protein
VPVRLPDGSVFSFNEIFPGGFTPKYSAIITDYSLTGGIKGVFEIGSGLSYDLSARYGEDRMKYKIVDTLNASLGPSSPRDFSRANYISNETSLNADFTYDIAVPAFFSPITAAFGLEYRNEEFVQEAAKDPLAYEVGPYAFSDPWGFCAAGATAPIGVNCADPDDPVYNTLPTLTLTVSPDTASELSRDSYAGYLEFSSDVTEKLFVDAALRYEDFSDFGDTINGKIAARYAITPDFAVRGSVGTGFRAPTPGQQSFSNVQWNTVDGAIQVTGLLPVSNPVASFLGARALEPEKSLSYSAGITASLPRGVNLSVDVYQIEIEDQFYRTSAITVTPAIRAQMIAAGVFGAESISQVQFFQNALDTKVQGLDVVATERLDWNNGQTTALTLSFNYNKYEIEEVKIANLFDAETVFDFENGTPQWRANFQATHSVGPFSFTGRGTLWGPYENMFSPSNPIVQKFDPELMVDLEMAYQINDQYQISIGARNIFDNYPATDEINEGTANGAIYRSDTPVDWQGGFYFVRLDAQF